MIGCCSASGYKFINEDGSKDQERLNSIFSDIEKFFERKNISETEKNVFFPALKNVTVLVIKTALFVAVDYILLLLKPSGCLS